MTGPRLRILFTGCRWNTIAFSMDSSSTEFVNWLNELTTTVETAVRTDPASFKVKPQSTPSFSSVLIPSPSMDFPDPFIRVRLATIGRGDEAVAVAYMVNKKTGEQMGPQGVMHGAFGTPVLKIGYTKDGDQFSLGLTLLKIDYEEPENRQIGNDAWIIDSKTSGEEGMESEDV